MLNFAILCHVFGYIFVWLRISIRKFYTPLSHCVGVMVGQYYGVSLWYLPRILCVRLSAYLRTGL